MESYIKHIWKGYPDKTTPITADMLNHMENGIEQNSNCIGNLDELETTEKDNLVAVVNELNSKLSHVGMIIHSTTLDTEAKVIAIYGGTKWTKIEGRFLLGQSSSYAVNSTGGEATHKLTASEMPSHNHAENAMAFGYDGWGTKTVAAYTAGISIKDSSYITSSGTLHATGVSFNISTNYTGGGTAHNNMPPYKTVYIWERTA